MTSYPMTPELLFSRASIHDVLQKQGQSVADCAEKLEPNYLLNVSEEELVQALINEHHLDVPILREEEIHVADFGETKVDVSQDPMRGFFDRGAPFYVPATRATIAVPFDGEPDFFQVRPSTFTSDPPRGKVVGDAVHLIYVRTDHAADAMKREYTSEVEKIKKYLGWLSTDTDRFNKQLESLVREEVSRRKHKLLSDAGMVAALGLPIKKREGAATTYAVPVQRKKPLIERPKASTSNFEPEPVLAMQDYEYTLATMKNMVRVMELSPRAFDRMGEEDLRTHFLVQLNAQYESQATGETFNFQGKTDILIRIEGRNVFIAECKFWNGEKQLIEALNQLLSYLSWRDTKTALLVFNRSANFTEVVAKLPGIVCSHPCFKRGPEQLDETTFRFVFHQPNDKNRELILTVMAFDIPTADHRVKSTSAKKVVS